MPEYIPLCNNDDQKALIAKCCPIDLEAMTLAYLECAEWCDLNADMLTPDDSDELVELPDDWQGFAFETIREAYAQCFDFVSSCIDNGIDFDQLEELYDANNSGSYDIAERFGHDFWLTRNGHGAGFWDRGLGKLGTQLTELCKPYGSTYAYLGDDGLGYIQ